MLAVLPSRGCGEMLSLELCFIDPLFIGPSHPLVWELKLSV